jgi:hypothetical protein
MHRGLRAVPVGIVLVYVAIVLALCEPGMVAFGTLLITYTEAMAAVWLIVGLCALFVAMVPRHGEGAPGSPWTIALDFFRSRWRQDRLSSVLTPFVCFVLLIPAYNTFKTLYLPSAGFWAGRYIARGDRALLGGRDAWQITHSMLSSPWATQVIDLAYHGWFLPMTFGVAVCSYVRPDSKIGWRYLTSYLLVWSVQGNLIAYLLPAAGPALHDRMYSKIGNFSALSSVLRSQDLYLRLRGAPGLSSVEYQRWLVTLFREETLAIGGGISAMPSLHNGLAVLFACAAWSIGRRAGIAATLYAVLIWFGSVHLGWHYALDGIVACALTVLIWVGVGRIPAFFERWRVAAFRVVAEERTLQEPPAA